MRSTDQLRRILDLVQDTLDEPELSGEGLAARAYLSRFHFDRLVAGALGEPPGAFRRRLLLERAAHRLFGTEDPVIEIALDAGYGSPEAFTRAFGRAYGSSPSAYRRRRVNDAIDDPSNRAPHAHRLPAPSGIHFHPPGGLRLPAPRRSTAMDVLTRLLDHHLWLVAEIVDRLTGLDDDVLHRPIELSVEGIDDGTPRFAASPTGSSDSWRCGSPRWAVLPTCRRRATRARRACAAGSNSSVPSSVSW